MATAVVKAEQAEVTTCKCGKPVTFEVVPCGCRLACDKCAVKLGPAASAGTARSGTAACDASLAAVRRPPSDNGRRFLSCALCLRPRSSVDAQVVGQPPNGAISAAAGTRSLYSDPDPHRGDDIFRLAA